MTAPLEGVRIVELGALLELSHRGRRILLQPMQAMGQEGAQRAVRDPALQADCETDRWLSHSTPISFHSDSNQRAAISS